MPGTTCLVTLNMAFKLVSITAFQSSGVIFKNMRSRVIPALLTSTSITPCCSTALVKAAVVDSQSATLPTDA